MYSPNLHHVKGSRSLDANSTHIANSADSNITSSSSTKITNMMNASTGTKQQQQQQQQKEHTHQHAHHHHHHNHSNSTSTNSLNHKKSSTSSLNGLPTSQHVKTNLAGTPLFIDPYYNKNNNNKFWRQQQQQQRENGSGIPEPGRSQSWPYMGYMLNGFKNLALTVYFNWPMLFTAPISSAAFFLVYPTTLFFLVIFEIGLKVFMEKWDGKYVAKYISLKFGQGFGAINWGAPELLLSDSSANIVQSTLPSLGLPATPITVSGCRRRTFDLSIAQTCVLLSSLIYERDSQKVQEAYDLYKVDMTAAAALGAETEFNQLGARMRELLWESESRIRQIAETWGLRFAGVSELKSLGGPFCGIFWSETVPFIVVAFKGTTPTNYEEFLVDATFQRTDARSFLFGSVHEGFYESLFSTTGFGQQDVRDPYGAILSSVQSKAAQIQEQLNTTEPIQLWITGHSLGAGLSSLLFSRWLKCPSDLSRRLVLRDAYVIGAPAVGDNDYASTFASHSNLPVTRSSTLWRIINKSDMFCRLPPGYDSKASGHYMSESDYFNYSHVGHAIQITRSWHSKPLKTFPSSYQPPMQVNIVTSSPSSSSSAIVYHQPHNHHHSQQQKPKKPVLPLASIESLPRWATFFMSFSWTEKVGNPIYFIEKMYPFFLMDHMPSQYFKGLSRARAYYENEELEQITESLSL